VVEYIAGEMKVLPSSHPWQASTNFSLTYSPTAESAKSQCWRYKEAYEVLEGAQGSITEEAAMEVLSSVSQSGTRWSMVYNLTTREVRVAMGRKYDQVLEFSLD